MKQKSRSFVLALGALLVLWVIYSRTPVQNGPMNILVPAAGLRGADIVIKEGDIVEPEPGVQNVIIESSTNLIVAGEILGADGTASGNGSSITLKAAGTVTIKGSARIYSGWGGSTNNRSVFGAANNVQTENAGHGGHITIEAGDSITIDSGARLEAGSGGNSGVAEHQALVGNASSISGAGGNGGNIIIKVSDATTGELTGGISIADHVTMKAGDGGEARRSHAVAYGPQEAKAKAGKGGDGGSIEMSAASERLIGINFWTSGDPKIGGIAIADVQTNWRTPATGGDGGNGSYVIFISKTRRFVLSSKDGANGGKAQTRILNGDYESYGGTGGGPGMPRQPAIPQGNVATGGTGGSGPPR